MRGRLAVVSFVVPLLLSACATPIGPASPDAAREAPANDVAPAAEASAPSTPTSNPAAARYALPRAQGTVGSVVVTNPLAPRTVDLTLRPDDIWDRVRNGFGIPNIESPLVAEQQAWYLSHPDYLRRAVDRSSRYLFHVVEELEKRHLPTELALLPFVESAYNPMAYSRAHASGMWQFIPGTGRTYNLKQDWWRDERRDVIASTDAALAYLQTIYEMHGDWHLALASYNWGEGNVKRAIERNGAAGLPTDYLNLPMPDETRNYVPKLQALKNIVANPEAFGVVLPRIDNEPYFVAVERSRDIDVRVAARLANMTLEDFRALNPSFNRPVIRATSGGTPLLVPADREGAFRSGMATREPLVTWQAHTVAKKETVERIAASYGMTSAALREVNGLAPKAKVRIGQGLLVQKRGGSGDLDLRAAVFEPIGDRGPFANDAGRSDYTVRPRDTLASIARRFDVPSARLRTANGLASDRVTAGQRLRIPGLAPAPTIKAIRATARRTDGGTIASKTTARAVPASKRTHRR